jgi:hypothetical protein
MKDREEELEQMWICFLTIISSSWNCYLYFEGKYLCNPAPDLIISDEDLLQLVFI